MMMKKNLVKVVKVCAAGCSLFVASRAFGGDVTWTGNANDGIWSTGANWSNNSGPGTGDSAVFNSSGGTITVNVTADYTMQNVRVLGSADVVVNIAGGVVLSCSNGGSVGLQANGADLTINGPGKLAISSAAGNNGINHLDSGASLGRTLAIHAEIIAVPSVNGGLTGFETWLASNATRGGNLILGYTANAFTLDMQASAGHTIIVSKLAPAGQPSCLGAINTVIPNRNTIIRYTGTGDTAGYAFALNGGDANLGFGGGIEHAGSGPLIWTGPAYNYSNSAQTLTLLGDSPADARFEGDIYNNQGTLAVLKEGSGTWVLAGSNTFTGGITVNGGTLGFDSTNAASITAQIAMAPGTALSVNPSATDGFTARIPALTTSGNVSISIADAPTDSTVTLGGLSGNFTITAPNAGTTANRIFVIGLSNGVVGPWITLNGGAAQYDPVTGLTPIALTTQGLATKGSTLPNGVDIAAVIDTAAYTGVPIALPANPTELYTLTQTVTDDDATVATAGKTLKAGIVAMTADADALTIGVAPQDGALLPPLSDEPPAPPTSADIAALNPLIWYDPSDALAVTLDNGTVIGLANKGVGLGLDAVVHSGWTGPLYATGPASHCDLPMIKIDSSTQGLQSAATTGISGDANRTLVTVMSRNVDQECIVSIGAGATRNVFENYLRNDYTRFGTFSDDLDMPVSPPETPIVMSFINDPNGNKNAIQGFADGTPGNIRTLGGNLNTSNTALHLGHRNGGHSNSYRGQIGEVLLFNYTLSDLQRQTVEAYLLYKWKKIATGYAQNAAITLRNDSLAAPLTVNASLAEPELSIIALTKEGPGAVTLAGGTSLSGMVRIDEGALTVATPPGLTDLFSGITSGPGKLIKSGTGTLSLTPLLPSLYTGGTDITGGALRIGHSAALGTGPLLIAPGGTLDIGGGKTANGITVSNPITVSGTGADGLGAIINSGATSQNAAFRYTTVTLADNASFGGDGASWDFRGGGNGMTLDLGGFTLSKTGASDLRFSEDITIANAPSGTALHIQQGTLGMAAGITLSPNTTAQTLAIDAGGRLGLYDLSTPLHWTIQPADGAEIWAYGTDSATNKNVLTADITLPGTLHLTAAGNFAKNLTGQISGTGGLSVHDGGDYAVSLLSNPNNLFQGPVAVSNAILGLRYPGSFPGGLAAIPSKISLASNTGSGVRVFAGADGWTGAEAAQLAGSGVFNNQVNHRFSIVVGQDEAVSLPAIASTFAGTFDKYGPGTLAMDGNVEPYYSRVNGGSIIFTNNATFRILAGANGLYLKDAVDFDNVNRDVYTLVGGDATITSTDLGFNTNGPPIVIGQNAGKAVLDLKDNAFIQAKIWMGYNNTDAYGAVYQSGGTFLSTGGAGNDGVIGNQGYGYYQLDSGDFIMKGYTQLGSANNGNSIGILRQTGGAMTFNGMRDPVPTEKGTFGESYDGNFGLSRGGKAVLHLEGGTFDHYGPLSIIDNNTSGGNIAATMTVTGTADVMVDRSIFMGNGNAGLASLNLNGGTLAAPQILRKNVAGSRAAVNFNGGLLRVIETDSFDSGRPYGLLTREGYTTADFHAYVYSGGARIEIADGLTRTVDIPLEQPAGSGIASIVIANAGSGYIGPPNVTINGGDNNATAIATIDRVTGQLTGIEITSPGTRYNTSTPSVSLNGGGGTGATVGTITHTGNSSGGLTKTGGGTLVLTVPNTYTGPTVVEAGTLALAHPDALHHDSEVIIHDGTLDLYGNTVTVRSITITGSGGIVNGKVITSSAVKTGPGTAIWDVGIEFAPVGEPLLPGLWEGHYKGTTGTVGAPGYYFDLTIPNPKASVQLSARAGDVPFGNNSDDPVRSVFWGNPRDFNMWIYTGYLWNRDPTNVTWTWRARFDDNSSLLIDGVLLVNQGNTAAATYTYTLTPGPHPIEIRFGDNTGQVGDNTANGGGLMYDPLGRNENTFENFIHLEDDGTGALLTANLPPPEPDSAVRVLEGTLQMPSTPAGRDPGLWEGGLKGNNNLWWDINTPNPSTSVQLTTRAGNGVKANNSIYNDGMWVDNYWTWVYTGYLWNRSGTNETWTWAGSFDDKIRLTIDGNMLLDHGFNSIGYANYTLTPGAHPIEIRFGDNTGNVGPDAGWASGIMYDRFGRGSTSAADYLVLEDDGTGFLLTTTLRDSAPTDLTDVIFDVADGAAIDFADTPRDGMIISPSGDDRTGTMSIDGMFNGSLNGVTYLVTVHDPIVPISPPVLNVPGLWEGHYKGAAGTYWDFGVPNPKTSVQLTTRAGNVPFGTNNSAPRAEFWDGNYNMWIYTGYVWNRDATNVTWTWRFRFDDNVSLMIDGVMVRNGNNNVAYTDHTLTPGSHAIEIRFGDGTGSVGDNTTGGGGLMYDPLGRGSTDFANYIHLEDPGDGSLLTTLPADIPGVTDTQVCDVITATGILNLNGLTIKPSDLPSATPPGSKYVIATADGFTGTPVLEGLDPKWKIIRKGTELLLTTQGGTMLILR